MPLPSPAPCAPRAHRAGGALRPHGMQHRGRPCVAKVDGKIQLLALLHAAGAHVQRHKGNQPLAQHLEGEGGGEGGTPAQVN